MGVGVKAFTGMVARAPKRPGYESGGQWPQARLTAKPVDGAGAEAAREAAGAYRSQGQRQTFMEGEGLYGLHTGQGCGQQGGRCCQGSRGRGIMGRQAGGVAVVNTPASPLIQPRSGPPCCADHRRSAAVRRASHVLAQPTASNRHAHAYGRTNRRAAGSRPGQAAAAAGANRPPSPTPTATRLPA